MFKDPILGDITLVRSSRARRVSIKVHPVSGVSVIVPYGFPISDGIRFFEQKRSWVQTVIARQKKKISDAVASGKGVSLLSDGSVVHSLMSEIVLIRSQKPGASVRLATSEKEDVKSAGRVSFSLDKPMFHKEVIYPLSFPDEGSAELDKCLRAIVVEVLRTEAKLVLPKKVSYFASKYGFRYSKVFIKHNATNWGSCSSLGNINLNLNLMRLPEPLCDCVILHELCHLRHRNHGDRFHYLLEQLCRDNLERLSSVGDSSARILVSEAAKSRAALPVHHTMEKELKKYRLL